MAVSPGTLPILPTESRYFVHHNSPLFNFYFFPVAPDSFNIIEKTLFSVKNMNNIVDIIKENPLSVIISFHSFRPHAMFFQKFFFNIVCDGPYLIIIISGCNNKIIRYCCNCRNIKYPCVSTLLSSIALYIVLSILSIYTISCLFL